MKINFQYSATALALNVALTKIRDEHARLYDEDERLDKALTKQMNADLKEANAIERDIAKQCGYGTVYTVMEPRWSNDGKKITVYVRYKFIAPPGYRRFEHSHYMQDDYNDRSAATTAAMHAMDAWLGTSQKNGCASFKDDLKKLMKKHNISTL